MSTTLRDLKKMQI